MYDVTQCCVVQVQWRFGRNQLYHIQNLKLAEKATFKKEAAYRLMLVVACSAHLLTLKMEAIRLRNSGERLQDCDASYFMRKYSSQSVLSELVSYARSYCLWSSSDHISTCNRSNCLKCKTKERREVKDEWGSETVERYSFPYGGKRRSPTLMAPRQYPLVLPMKIRWREGACQSQSHVTTDD
jgi:hypothetical protein